MRNLFNIFFLCLIISISATQSLQAEKINKIIISGNERISDETLIVYGEIKKNQDYTQNDIDTIIKNLYDTKFFSNISINLSGGILKINVIENPIINSITLQGEPTKKFAKALRNFMVLKEKSSYLKSDVKNDVEIIKGFYSQQGYYSSNVEARTKEVKGGNNLVDLIFIIDKGKREKITKIFFIGEKKVKTKRLRDVIATEEAKFWKIISRNIYLNDQRIELDKRLLKNYYLSKGYYDVEILSSNVFIDENKGIELTFNINAGKRYRIKKISTDIDPVFDKKIFKILEEDFKKFAGSYYSPFKITKILESIDDLIDDNELQFVTHSVSETVDGNFIDLEFKIFEGRKIVVERINIKGNTITNDSVIRSELILDEGDPFSKIKLDKSINNLKSKNIFKKVNYKLSDGSSKNFKVMEVVVEEMPTGEIAAAAGTGTDGTTLSFSLKENNYLGKGQVVDASIDASQSSLRGGLSVTNPNYNFSGNLLTYGLSSLKTDRPNSGYENTLTQFNIGTRFEQYDDIYLSPNLELSFDDMTVNSTASDRLKKQAGSFNELSFGYGIEKDTRDRRFMPTSGSIFGFSQKLPVYVEDNTSVFNRFNLSKYHSFNENILGAFKFYAAAIVAIEDDVRLSKRIHIPSRRLRGFESRKVGPVDSGDYVGGNYAMAMNFEAALPNLLPEATQTDVAAFLDIGNLWHADYDSTVGQSSIIRSAIGIATNVYTPIGPLNFVFAQDLSSADSDTTQQFKFQIGTSF